VVGRQFIREERFLALIPLTGLGGLFTRIGRDGWTAYLLNQVQPSFQASFLQIISQFPNADEPVIAQILRAYPTLVRSTSSMMGATPSLAIGTVQAMVSDINPIIGQSIQGSLTALINQMNATGQTVARCTVSAVSTPQAGVIGNGVVVLSTKRGDGLTQENLIAEAALLICTQDSYTGGATAGRETFQFLGQPQTGGTWDWDWPQGSGAVASLSAISSTQSGTASGNLLTNSNFENWTAGALNNWRLAVGTWGIDAQQSNNAFLGSYAVQINPTGTPIQLIQTFGSGATGTSPTLTGQRSYPFNLWVRATSASGTPIGGVLLTLTQAGVPITSGVLAIELIDGSGNVTTDNQGVPNSVTVPATSLSGLGIWTPVNGVFRVPLPTPNALQFRIRESVPFVGSGVLIDAVAMSQFNQPYAGGLGIAYFSGNIPSVLNDAYTVQTNNNRANSAYCSTFQSLFDRLFGMRSLNLLLPSSNSPTIPDSLITAYGGTPIGGLLLTLTRT